jgi:hypothetical protein
MTLTPTQRQQIVASVLVAVQRNRWSAEAMPATGLAAVPAGAGLGLLLRVGQTTWWLRFSLQPTLHVQAIERFTPAGGDRR